MIASLTGTVESAGQSEAIINVNGVGYLVFVSAYTADWLARAPGAVRLSVVTVVREDDISLYGFADDEEKRLFGLLVSVNGIGPKVALKILSGIEPSRLENALAGGDIALLSTISGVGKKIAQRLIVELKDKVTATIGYVGPKSSTPSKAEAVSALTGLGYQPKVAEKAIAKALEEGATSVEEVVRSALKDLKPKR